MIKENLEKKAWYRLVKVIYIGLYCITLLLVSLIAYTQKPQIVADADKSAIVCSNNQRFNAEDAGIYGFELNVEQKVKNQNSTFNRVTLINNEVSKSVAEEATKVCQQSYQRQGPNYIEQTDGKNKWLEDTLSGEKLTLDKEWRWNARLNDWEENTSTKLVEYPQANQFSIDTTFHINGGWGKVAQWFFVGFAITTFSFEFIRRIFLYITTGKQE